MQRPGDEMQRCYDKKIKEIVHAGGRMGSLQITGKEEYRKIENVMLSITKKEKG